MHVYSNETNTCTRKQVATQGRIDKGTDFNVQYVSHFVIILFYLSASSSTIISTVCRLNDGVLCKWSTSLPGVAITTSGPLRNAASWLFPSKPPGKSLGRSNTVMTRNLSHFFNTWLRVIHVFHGLSEIEWVKNVFLTHSWGLGIGHVTCGMGSCFCCICHCWLSHPPTHPKILSFYAMPVFFFPWQLLDLWKTSSGKSTCSTLEGKNSHKPMTEVVSLTIKYVHGCKYTLRIHGKQAYYQLKRLLMFSITSKHPPVARHTWMLVCLDNALVTEWICDKKESHCLILHVMLKIFKKESNTSSFSKWKKTLNRDCLHCIGNFCAIVSNIFSKEVISNNTKCRKQMLKFIWNPW